MNRKNASRNEAPEGESGIDRTDEKATFDPSCLDDKALWEALRTGGGGGEKALIAIYNRTVKSLFSYGVKCCPEREIVKDSIQELFIELWKNRQRLGETNSVKFYLLVSLRRKIARTISKVNYRMAVRLENDMDAETSSFESELIEIESASSRKEKLAFLMNKLTKRQRLAIHLRYFEEMEYDKIAELLNLNKQTVYNLISKAIEALKSHYTADP